GWGTGDAGGGSGGRASPLRSLDLALGDFEPRVKRSAARRALRIDVERIERVARRHEQPVALDTAEAEIGAALGQRDEADGFAARAENLHPVPLRAPHPPAPPPIPA